MISRPFAVCRRCTRFDCILYSSKATAMELKHCTFQMIISSMRTYGEHKTRRNVEENCVDTSLCKWLLPKPKMFRCIQISFANSSEISKYKKKSKICKTNEEKKKRNRRQTISDSFRFCCFFLRNLSDASLDWSNLENNNTESWNKKMFFVEYFLFFFRRVASTWSEQGKREDDVNLLLLPFFISHVFAWTANKFIPLSFRGD